jgi:hypothetical protein
VFRGALMDHWGGCCAVTGCAEPLLSRARRIKAWALCETGAERLDAYNAYRWPLISDPLGRALSPADRLAGGLHDAMELTKLTLEHRPYLA